MVYIENFVCAITIARDPDKFQIFKSSITQFEIGRPVWISDPTLTNGKSAGAVYKDISLN